MNRLRRPRRIARAAFTLVELLVVIVIISMLVALLVPAVQAAREAGRRATCANNLRNLGAATMQHLAKFDRYPSGGWGWNYVGEPERGTDRRQPGGWSFNLLGYIDQENLRSMGKGLTGSARNDAIVQRCQTPLELFHCPTRRRPTVYPDPDGTTFITETSAALSITLAARSDYAINAGDQPNPDTNPDSRFFAGPPTFAEGDDPNYTGWSDTSKYTGICYERSEVRKEHVRDGATSTYLIAEKYLNPAEYTTGNDPGDSRNMYVGFSRDTFRVTSTKFGPPLQDTRNSPDATTTSNRTNVFGSAHSGIFQAVMCDGSVHGVSYNVDATVHRNLGNRADGASVDVTKLK
jgi:prepilin-type N-terminal cleavage/methylation domain-containing protein